MGSSSQKNLTSIIFTFFMAIWAFNSTLAFHPEKYASLVVDQTSGKILHEENADKIRHPASITKVMTLYLTFEALKSKKISLDQTVTVSSKAASMPRTNLSLRTGQKMKIRDALNAAAIKSANDAAIILAESIAGSEENFVRIMNERAKMLGMNHTFYRNVSGLPDSGQKSSAYDIAKLAIAIQRDFPEYYDIFSKKEFVFNGKKYKTTNKLLTHYKYPGVTGLKTGFINMSGFNLVTTINRDGKKLVAVVLGGNTGAARDTKMMALIDKFSPRSKNTMLVQAPKNLKSYPVSNLRKIPKANSNNIKPVNNIQTKKAKKKIKLAQNSTKATAK